MRVFGRSLILAALLCASAPSAGERGAYSQRHARRTGLRRAGVQILPSVTAASLTSTPSQRSSERFVRERARRCAVQIHRDRRHDASGHGDPAGLFEGFFGLVRWGHAGAELSHLFQSGGGRRRQSPGLRVSVSVTPIPLGGSSARTYILALIAADNTFGSSHFGTGLDSLLTAFALDDPEIHSPCVGSCGYSVDLNAFPVDGSRHPYRNPERWCCSEAVWRPHWRARARKRLR